jgi:hypothetical protein
MKPAASASEEAYSSQELVKVLPFSAFQPDTKPAPKPVSPANVLRKLVNQETDHRFTIKTCIPLFFSHDSAPAKGKHLRFSVCCLSCNL